MEKSFTMEHIRLQRFRKSQLCIASQLLRVMKLEQEHLKNEVHFVLSKEDWRLEMLLFESRLHDIETFIAELKDALE